MSKIGKYAQGLAEVTRSERETCVTKDGQAVHFYGNIGRPDESQDIVRHYLEGVGLFRTEYLFLGVPEPPDFDTQKDVYSQTAEALDGRPLTVRTVDFGGDKKPLFTPAGFEANPNLGLRGLRFSLADKELFSEQIKAILCASQNRNIRILFPMVLGGADLRAALEFVHSVATELAIDKIPPVGALIETPAAIFELEEIIKQVDFLSIGTNDLAQFILAADRLSVDLLEDYSVLHPSVLRAVKQVLSEAEKHDCPVSVCGEAAGNPGVACLLVGMGVRYLSMSPARAAQVGYAIRQLDSLEATSVAEKAICSESPDEVQELVNKLAKAKPSLI